MQMQEIRTKDDAALAKLLAEAREELRKFRFNVAGSALRDVRAARTNKKTVARILTEQTARQRTTA